MVSVFTKSAGAGGGILRRKPSKGFSAFSVLLGAVVVGILVFRNSQIPYDQTSLLSSTTTSFHKDQNNLLDLWWMSNLRDTTLRMTDSPEPASSEPRQFIFPPETKKVWVDVGVNQRTDFLPNLLKDNSLFVLGFEPSQLWRPCTEHVHCEVFWAACTPDFDVVHLNVQGDQHVHGLCDSLLKPKRNTTTRIYKPCVTQQKDKKTGKPKTVQTPGIPLHAMIERIPSHIDVEYIKIDAQGYDLEVMKGVISPMTISHDRVQVVSLETMDVTDPEQVLYVGQPLFQEVKDYLEQRGWIHVQSVSNKGAKGEVNAFFISHERYRDKVDRLAEELMSNKEGQQGKGNRH
jgi:hypothetical protein